MWLLSAFNLLNMSGVTVCTNPCPIQYMHEISTEGSLISKQDEARNWPPRPEFPKTNLLRWTTGQGTDFAEQSSHGLLLTCVNSFQDMWDGSLPWNQQLKSIFLETNSSKASESAVKKETLLSKGEIESSSKHHLLDVLAVRLRERERVYIIYGEKWSSFGQWRCCKKGLPINR